MYNNSRQCREQASTKLGERAKESLKAVGNIDALWTCNLSILMDLHVPTCTSEAPLSVQLTPALSSYYPPQTHTQQLQTDRAEL